MIKEVFIKNFQSLYDVSLTFGKFTVIHGESDVGKSAFYRALRSLFTNALGDAFISHGESVSSVRVILDSSEEIIWSKSRGKTASYRLNEKIWNRIKGVPEEISKLLRICCVEISGDSFYPNLRGQFDSLFMLFSSPSKRAKVIGFLTSNILLSGIREANVERNRNEADIRALDDLVISLEKKLSFDWNSVSLSIEKILSFAKSIFDLEKFYAYFSSLYNFYLKIQDIINISLKINLIVSSMDNLVGKVEKYYTLYEELKSKYLSVQLASKSLKFSSVSFLPENFFSIINRLVAMGSQFDSLYREYSIATQNSLVCKSDLKNRETAMIKAKFELDSVTIACPKCSFVFPLIQVKS